MRRTTSTQLLATWVSTLCKAKRKKKSWEYNKIIPSGKKKKNKFKRRWGMGQPKGITKKSLGQAPGNQTVLEPVLTCHSWNSTLPRFLALPSPGSLFTQLGWKENGEDPECCRRWQAPTTGWNGPLYRAISIREPVDNWNSQVTKKVHGRGS